MYKVLVYGAGSIGNHLTHGCRQKNWAVTMVDVDHAALERTKTQLYPSRYGSWDESIRLFTLDKLPKENYDIVIIGTPPDTHVSIALEVLKNFPPKVLLIEKPLCTPALERVDLLEELSTKTNTMTLVGYNHVMADNTQQLEKLLKTLDLGKPLTMTALFREHWKGIFGAHPWLEGPQDTYLGYTHRGGGASGEHSHAINIWQHFAHTLGLGRITNVSAMMDFVKDGKVSYDRICQLNVKTESGLVGNIVQDVITEPSQKKVRIQFEKGQLEWIVNVEKDKDAVKWTLLNGTSDQIIIPKKRPDDFKGEINHIEDLLAGRTSYKSSALSLTRGLETMLVVAACGISHEKGKTVTLSYPSNNCGFRLNAIQ